MSRFCIGALCLAALAAAPGLVAADDPARPTSDFGSMPNGWAGYSLQQHPTLLPRRPRPAPAPAPGNGGHGDGDHAHGDHGHHGHGHHGHGHHGHGHHGHGHGHFWPGYGYPVYGYPGYGYSGYGYRFGGLCPVCLQASCFDPYCNVYVTHGVRLSVGAAVAPLAWLQQRQAIQNQQLAAIAAARAHRPAGLAAAADPGEAAVDPAAAADAAAEIRRRVSVLRESKPGGRQRADRLIALADRYFAEQDYRRAVSKYRDAMAQAADYPAAHFRLGHAYIATGDLELALTYFLMALELSGSIERPGFSLEDMYRGNEVAKQTHIDSLSDAALRQPEDGGLLMLVGLSLHYDGQPLRARSFLEQAARLPGAQQAFAAMFLPSLPAATDALAPSTPHIPAPDAAVTPDKESAAAGAPDLAAPLDSPVPLSRPPITLPGPLQFEG